METTLEQPYSVENDPSIMPNWLERAVDTVALANKMFTPPTEPATPVCPMTWAELQNKGFRGLSKTTRTSMPFVDINFYAFGKKFIDSAETLDQAAELIWQQFCDFINGREN